MHIFGMALLSLGVFGLLAMAGDIALSQWRSMRRESILDERLSDKARWR